MAKAAKQEVDSRAKPKDFKGTAGNVSHLDLDTSMQTAQTIRTGARQEIIKGRKAQAKVERAIK